MTTVATLDEVPGLLTSEEVAASAAYLANLQLASGLVPWFPQGHADPWNHVEAAMALTVTGYRGEAVAAYDWLLRHQRRDGSWFNYYVDEWVERPRLDTNVCAYVATGVWHYWRVTQDEDAVRRWWPMVQRAMAFVLRWQRADGTVAWSIDERGRPAPDALLTGSCSIAHALSCASALAVALGEPDLEWRTAAARLRHVIRRHPDAFTPKDIFAMDWYYPALSGVWSLPQARARLEAGWDQFVLPGRGVRCVSTNEWATAAETSECVLALVGVGALDHARALFETTRRHRRPDGAYLTGWVYPQEVTFPTDEVSSYTVAAVLLAADALAGATPGATVFAHPGELGEWSEAGCSSVPAGADDAHEGS